MKRLFLAIAGSALLGGCGFTSSPQASVTRVSLVDTSPRGGRVEFELDLRNPNDVPLPLSSLTYTVDVDGAEPFTYTGPPGVNLPAKGEQTVRLPAGIRRDAGGEPGTPEAPGAPETLVGRSYDVSGSVTYRPPGQIKSLLYDSGVPLPWFSFDAEGKLK